MPRCARDDVNNQAPALVAMALVKIMQVVCVIARRTRPGVAIQKEKGMDAATTRSMTLVAIIAFHCSSHSVVSRSEIAESKKGMDAATTRSMTEESKQNDVNNQAPTLLAMAPGKTMHVV